MDLRTAHKQPAANTNDGFEEIPPELLNDTSMDTGGASVGGPKACPHCTFENEPGATDCMICGLPLAG